MSAREAILARVREALRTPAPKPGHGSQPEGLPAADPTGFQRWLPAVGPTWDEQCRLFAQNAAALKAEFKLVPDPSAAAEEIRGLARQGNWSKGATHGGPLTDLACRGLELEWLRTDEPYELARLERCDASVTACEALIAQTGSVLITSRSCGGRAVSVLPPHHVVVATAEQLLPDLPAAFALLRRKYHGDYPSCLSFITGPSRTGDIERILVLGAHGPKRLTILLVNPTVTDAR